MKIEIESAYPFIQVDCTFMRDSLETHPLAMGSRAISTDYNDRLFVFRIGAEKFLKYRLTDGQYTVDERGLRRASETKYLERWSLNRDTYSTEAIILQARRWLGVPYDTTHKVNDPTKALDCSGLAQHVYKTVTGIKLHHKAAKQWELGPGRKIRQKINVKVGDLLFFGNDEHGIYHVGICSGQDKMIHSTEKKGGVVETTFMKRKDFVGARRIIASEKYSTVMKWV